MSKKNKEVFNEPVDQIQPESKQPAFIDELLKNGTAIITAKTREELAEIVNDIPAECKYGTGAVGQSRENGEYSIRIDIVH
jgi:hypothetical protein